MVTGISAHFFKAEIHNVNYNDNPFNLLTQPSPLAKFASSHWK